MLLALILILNLVVSLANAYSAGLSWHARRDGTFAWLLVWSTVIQAVIGFSSVIVFAETYVLHALGLLPDAAMKATIALWYLMVIIPAIGTGLVITAHSWREAIRERSLMNVGAAAWNTVATGHNVIGASSGIGQAFGTVTSFFTDAADDEDGIPAVVFGIVLGCVFVSLAGGVVATMAIMASAEKRARSFEPLAA